MIRVWINNQEIDPPIFEPEQEKGLFPITFSQSDAKEPNETRRSATKTIDFPGTRRNNAFFMSAYNLSISDIDGQGIGFDFDPTVRYPVQVERNGKPIFIGVGNLQKVMQKNKVNTFKFVMYSNIVGIVQALGDTLVSELGWSDYNETLSIANIQASWTAGTGSGILWPYIYYGFDQDPLQIKTNQLFPHVYEVEIIEKALAVGGYTLSSTFFDTSVQQSVVWGWGGGELEEIDSTTAADRHVEVTGDGVSGATWDMTGNPVPFPLSGYTLFYGEFELPISDNGILDVTEVDDPDNQYSTSTGEIVIQAQGTYNMQFSGTFPITYAYSSVLTNEEYKLTFKNVIYKNFAEVSTQDIVVTDTASGTDTVVFNHSIELNAGSGDVISSKLFVSMQGSKAGQVSAATLDLTLDFNNTLLYEMDNVVTSIIDGDTVEVAAFLPKQKASDYIKDIILQYNLYVSDPDEDGAITMLPLDQYFFGTNDVDDWTKKLARDQDILIEPASKIEGKTYSFRWAEDRDYYKQLYFNENGIDYGDYNYEVPSTFKTGVRTYQLKSAMSVPVQIEGTDIIIPWIIQRNDTTGVASPHKGKPRKYYYNGVVSSDTWVLRNSNTGIGFNQTQYPLVHHLDDLTTPTKDLCFNYPEEVYYTATAYTTNGLFQAYHAQSIREITSRDSKIVNAWFRLTEDDLYDNFMRRQCIIDGVVYRKNIIKDFIANGNNLVKCELIKVLEGNNRGTYTIGIPLKGTPKMAGTGDFDYPVDSDISAKSYRLFYPVDTSGKDITITLDADSLKKGWTGEFVKLDAANNLILSATGGGATGTNINGAATLTITKQYDAPQIRFDGQYFYIK